MPSRPVLVTGASGFLGQALVRQLVAGGAAVTAVSRHGAEGRAPAWVPVQRYEEAGRLMAGHACMVHLAARVHVMRETAQDPLAAFRAANVALTHQLARQAAAAGIERFVFLSSVKVNGEATRPGHPFTENDVCAPQDPYGQSKLEAEQGLRDIAAETGMQVVIIRPPLIYGPGVAGNFAALMRAVARGLPLPLGAIDNRRSLVGRDNLIDFILCCIAHPDAANQTFLVSDGEDLATPELVRRLARVMGKPDRLIPVPVWLLRAGASVLGRQDSLQRLCENLQLSTDKARNLLGWRPALGVNEGLRRALRTDAP